MNFIIPNASNNLDLVSKSKSDLKTESDDITKYTKLCQNVYKFSKTVTSESAPENIYMLYNNACEIKEKDYIQALQMFKKCEELIDNNANDTNNTNNINNTNIIYEIYVNLALLSSNCEDIKKYYTKAINTIDDRAEPYYYWSLYCNQHNLFEVSYTLLKHAINISYEQATKKYANVQRTAYDKYLYEELFIACYELKKYNECRYYLEQLIHDVDFIDRKDDFIKMLNLTNNIITI